MTKESLAAQLNNRTIGREITPAEESAAKAAGLVVIFGASDDLCELRGAMDDEVGAWQGRQLLIGKTGLLPDMEEGDMEVLKRHGVLMMTMRLRDQTAKVLACWCKGNDYSWTYETTAPHATFDILEDGEKYCRGIVLDLKELK